MINERIKMRNIIYTMVLLALLTGCTHRTATPPEDSLYRCYAEREDLKVAQLNGFKLNDTVRVDVIMLQADDEQSWQQLAAEFDVRGDEGSVSWLGEMDAPVNRTQWSGNPVMRVIASHDKRTIGFYRIDNEMQYDALIDYQLNNIRTK